MTELGVYILGAAALAILAAAGIALEQAVSLVDAVVASGAAYLAQSFAHAFRERPEWLWAGLLNLFFALGGFVLWAHGVWHLL